MQRLQTVISLPDPSLDCAPLAATIARFAETDDSYHTAIPSLRFHRISAPSEPTYCVYEPALTIVAQGTKQVVLGEEILEYDPANYLVTSVDLPVVCQVVKATPGAPFLCLSVALDLRKIADLLSEMPSDPVAPVRRGMSVGRLTSPLLDAVLRLVRLLDNPVDIPILLPVIEREILYRLLTGDQGGRLRHMAASDSRTHQVARAIDWLKNNYAQPLRIEDLARTAHMSVSSLHHHFKMITAMTPLQYQKQLRLQEARRLMLSERVDAASAGHRVGYESPSQFSREYRRLYGAPPLRDIAQLR
ncbi:AraC family transcriptional regulator [Telmatospirillum siberiense]|uniref:AraC family transcriptional regulator n=2 Tax=Telmatospirillum siberiense TaxID=382514 RepID=A0A2N3PZ50_9PROT|nr:AraC family transcriptional regulator [Telmatospirillum siberiense]